MPPDEATALFSQLKPTLPILLANLTTIGKIAVTYNASIEQMMVLFLPFAAATQTRRPAAQRDRHDAGRLHRGERRPACLHGVGFLPRRRGVLPTI